MSSPVPRVLKSSISYFYIDSYLVIYFRIPLLHIPIIRDLCNILYIENGAILVLLYISYALDFYHPFLTSHTYRYIWFGTLVDAYRWITCYRVSIFTCIYIYVTSNPCYSRQNCSHPNVIYGVGVGIVLPQISVFYLSLRKWISVIYSSIIYS